MDDVHNIVAHTRIFLSPFFFSAVSSFHNALPLFLRWRWKQLFLYTHHSQFFLSSCSKSIVTDLCFTIYLKLDFIDIHTSLFCSFSLTFNLRLFKEQQREKNIYDEEEEATRTKLMSHKIFLKTFSNKNISLKELKIFVANSVRFNKSTSFCS